MKTLNWLLYEVHRWLGVVLAVFMLVWFASGILIMYSTPMTQTRAQQLQHAEALAPESGWLSLGDVWERSVEQRQASAAAFKATAASGGEGVRGEKNAGLSKDEPAATIAEARLARIAGQPLWLVEDSKGLRVSLSAIDGSVINVSPEQALQIAENWYKAEQAEVRGLTYLETVDNPVILRNQSALRPFHRIADFTGGELLISARTGEVLHASTRLDRALYYAGNWIHLFKPLESMGLGEIRHDVQLWSGLGATIACVTGLVIGWLRWRPGFGGKPTYSQGRTQPYREFWFKWHFWTGLLGGTVALGWALSGFIDTNPGKLFSEANPSRAELRRYQGKVLPDPMRNWLPEPLVQISGTDIVELDWRRLGDEAVLLAHGRDGRRLPQAVDGAVKTFSKPALTAAVQRLVKDAEIVDQEILADYDSYYYPRHHQSLVEKPLPVVAVQLADEGATRLYLDPQDGRVLARLDDSRRVFRWLYSGLHHWDFGWLYYRPIWDIWMLNWVCFGLLLGASSVVIGWRRLQKTFTPKKKRVTRGGRVAEPALATESAGD